MLRRPLLLTAIAAVVVVLLAPVADAAPRAVPKPTAVVKALGAADQRTLGVVIVAANGPVAIEWGDGKSSIGNVPCSKARLLRNPRACKASASHTYATNGTFTVAVSVNGQRILTSPQTIGDGVAPAAVTPAVPSDPTTYRAPDAGAIGKVGANWEQELLVALNGVRASVGLPPLALCAALSKAAQWKANDQARTAVMSHQSDAGNPLDIIRANGYDAGAWGENVAYGQNSSTEVNTDWRNSPPHYENMVRPVFTVVGLGVQQSPVNGALYWAEEFGGTTACSA